MNAAPPVFQAQPVSDSVQPDTPAGAASATTRPGSQDFAAALSDAGGKPVRKNASNKQSDPASSGSSLPASGNQPPVAFTPPPPAKTDVPAAPAADAAAIAKASGGSLQGPAPGGITAASTAPANAGGLATTLGADGLDPAAPFADPAALATAGPLAPTAAASAAASAAVAPALTAPPAASAAGLDATIPSSAAGPAVAGLAMPHAASIRTPPAPGASTAAAVSAAKLRDTAANQNTNASGTSAPSSADANALNDSPSSTDPAAPGTDAAAQAAMAAAMAQGTPAPPPDSSSSDEEAIPATGVAQGAASPSDPAADAPAAAFARASAASMVAAAATAATAASVAQAVSEAAGAGAVDKRSHGNGADSSLSAASNDGSIGAAQLLTSNTSTDSGVPMPTFKVPAGVDTAQFGQGVADRVSLMMDGNLTNAKLQVNPPALGPIEVRIALQGGHAQVSFSSHSAVTRDALESSSEKLREMLGSQGFSSVSVDISQRSFQERSPQSQAYESSPAGSAAAPVPVHAPRSMPRSASGLLDAYA